MILWDNWGYWMYGITENYGWRTTMLNVSVIYSGQEK